MNLQLEEVLGQIDESIIDFERIIQVGKDLQIDPTSLRVFDELIIFCQSLRDTVLKDRLKGLWLSQFIGSLKNIVSTLPFKDGYDSEIWKKNGEQWSNGIRSVIQRECDKSAHLYQDLWFKFDFYRAIGFFNTNIVAIGSNGSGKTSLSNKFKSHLGNNGIVISAQRILLAPTFRDITNPINAATELKKLQEKSKTNKSKEEYTELQQEFAVLLKNLVAQNSEAGNQYRQAALKLQMKGEPLQPPPVTNLDKVLEIWNTLIEHRKVICTDGINIMATVKDGIPYPVIKMSDGEKVMLYLIGQVLLAPINGFIVIDEPEMYLHKTILAKLWDILEKERHDCLFIYLTHDLYFATGRTTAKKIWIKSFLHPDKWEIEDIPENDIPEALLLELLGSKKNILFCEGRKGSIDERIYSLLFENFTVSPVGSCFDVIYYTKAFNKIQNLNNGAYGLIDSDHHAPERLDKLTKENIYHYSLAEVENLFLDEDFLSVISKKIHSPIAAVEKIKKDVISELDKHKTLQISNYITSKINYYFNDSHVSKGNSLDEVKKHYQSFTDEIKIDDWYNQRKNQIHDIIKKEDYKAAIAIFNHKALHRVASTALKITDFTDRAIDILHFDPLVYPFFYAYFPKEIVQKGKKITTQPIASSSL